MIIKHSFQLGSLFNDTNVHILPSRFSKLPLWMDFEGSSWERHQADIFTFCRLQNKPVVWQQDKQNPNTFFLQPKAEERQQKGQ